MLWRYYSSLFRVNDDDGDDENNSVASRAPRITDGNLGDTTTDSKENTDDGVPFGRASIWPRKETRRSNSNTSDRHVVDQRRDNVVDAAVAWAFEEDVGNEKEMSWHVEIDLVSNVNGRRRRRQGEDPSSELFRPRNQT